MSKNFNLTRLRSIGLILTLSLLFGLIYTQSPLYTSNQNQYFLHGLARAGFGNLSEDWLANTLDPTPVFSLLVYLTYRYLHLEALFYLYYIVLMGVYLFSLLGIVEVVLPPGGNRTKWTLLLTLVLVVNSAALRFLFSSTLGENWKYVLEDGVADQRLLGPVLQPSAFGVLLLLSIWLFLKEKPLLAVFSAVLAATIHPTYLLPAALLTLGFMITQALDARRASREKPGRIQDMRRPLLTGLFALLCVSPALVYVYTNFAGTPPQTTALARQILVHYRIPHHALVSWWFDATVLIKITLVVASLYLVRRTRLFPILSTVFAAAAILTLLQVTTGSDMLALIFPWRVSTILVPIATAVLVTALGSTLWSRLIEKSQALVRLTFVSSTALIIMAAVVGAVRYSLEFQRKATTAEEGLFTYISDQNQSGQVYLIPSKMQEFRLMTGAPAFVDFKSIPYGDQDVLEWRRRIELVDAIYKDGNCALASSQLRQEGITHLVMPADSPASNCTVPGQALYEDASYRLFTLQVP